jgi:hypothetical protein
LIGFEYQFSLSNCRAFSRATGQTSSARSWSSPSDLNDHIDQEGILLVANPIGRDHGDVREVLSALSFVLAETIHHRTKSIDTPTAQMFLSQSSSPPDDRDIMNILSLVDQLALVAIFKAGRSWVRAHKTSSLLGMGLPFGISEIQGRMINSELFHGGERESFKRMM